MIKKEKIQRTDAEWREMLTEEQYRVLREKGTEAPGSGEYYEMKEPGIYLCAGCGNELFSSETKYDSGSGWPSFYALTSDKSVELEMDRSMGTVRIEVVCSRCGGHLGHVFDDGPEPTGKRYCINLVALRFKKS